jgi:hypothetical protein
MSRLLATGPNDTLDPTDLTWFLALPSTTAVRVEPSPRDHIATKQHKDAYADSRTIADLFLPSGSRPDLARIRLNDIKWDLAKGSIWVGATPPSARPPTPVASLHAVPLRPATTATDPFSYASSDDEDDLPLYPDLVDPTLSEFSRLEDLEDHCDPTSRPPTTYEASILAHANRIMLSSLRENYPLDTDEDPASYDPPLFAAVFSLHTPSPSLPTSAHNAICFHTPRLQARE